MRSLLLILALLPLALPAAAQDDALARGRAALDAAVLSGSVDSLQMARAQIQLAASGDHADWATYYTALTDYRLGYAFWGAQPEQAGQHAALGASALADLRRQRLAEPLKAEAAALHSALLGMQIGLDASLGMTLGQTAAQATAEANRLAADNPRVQFVEATSLLSTPAEWGGDPDRALALLQTAVATFEASGEAATQEAPTWGHADAAAWLAMAHLMRGEAAPARVALETAEALNPNSDFVRFKLVV
ncbi:MAG: hypothetical protein AAFQ43_04205 [Bacteroidota bacterium]